MQADSAGQVSLAEWERALKAIALDMRPANYLKLFRARLSLSAVPP